MPVAVVKLGSSVVAHDTGELRLSVVARGSARRSPRCTATGVDVVVVTSGAIARGMRLLELPVRPTEIAELQAASAVGQGRLYRTYDELLREQGLQTAQVLLTFFDMSARTHYLNARRTLQTLLGWRIVPVINENDTTTTDEISFGDNDFLAAQVAVLVGAQLLVLLTDTDGLYTAEPAQRPGRRGSSRRSPIRRSCDALRDRPRGLAARLGRDALEGRRGRDGDGGRHPDRDRERVRARRARRARGPASASGTRFAPQAVRHSSFKLWLKYAKPSQGTRDGRRRRGAGAARRRHEPAAGRRSSTSPASSTRATRSTVREAGAARDRQGDLRTTRPASCAA